MSEYGRIAVLENEVEARVLDGVLNDLDIPHAMRSYADFAKDGVFQMTEACADCARATH